MDNKEPLMDDILSLLKERFNGDKEEASKFLLAHNVPNWQALVEAEFEVKHAILRKLKSERQYVTLETSTHVITRPKNTQSISDITFSIKGYNPFKRN